MTPVKTVPTPNELELRGFNRSLAEIEWLLLVLILAHIIVPGAPVADEPQVIAACVLFSLFVLGFRYFNILRIETRWKLTIETWAMIAITAFVVWKTGRIDSPLLNLYLLVIIFSGLTLGKAITLLEVGLIASLYLHAGYATLGDDLFAYHTFSNLMLSFAPFVLVAYLTALLGADMQLARASAQKLSETDELTDLPNMRSFTASLERECRRAEVVGTSFGLLMIDADNLKPINDELGHEAGNEMIRHLVGNINRGLRASDIIARYGGDEFLVLLPEADTEATAEVAERIRQAVANSAIDIGGRPTSVTASIGAVVYPEDGTDPQTLLNRVDQALNESKRRGRDCVYRYETESGWPQPQQT
jgi:diguanylate cyclase (GGDEF)-like protein